MVVVLNKLLVKDQTIELKRTLTLEDSLNELEAILIQVLEPRLNRKGPNWIKAEECLQPPRSSEEGEDEDEVGQGGVERASRTSPITLNPALPRKSFEPSLLFA
jgi:hypothetical protein